MSVVFFLIFIKLFFHSSPSLLSFFSQPTTPQPISHPLLQKDTMRRKFIETVALRFWKFMDSRPTAAEPSCDYVLGPLHVSNSCEAWSCWRTLVCGTTIYPWCMHCDLYQIPCGGMPCSALILDGGACSCFNFMCLFVF